MDLCQCPERGDPHFYSLKVHIKTYFNFNCGNALKGATRISTQDNASMRSRNSVWQCPERGNPHFYESYVARL